PLLRSGPARHEVWHERRLSLSFRSARPHRHHGVRRPRAGHDRAIALHQSRRARQPAGLRQRPAATGVRTEQPGARGGPPVHCSGRPPALARRRDRRTVAGGHQRELDVAHHRGVRGAAHRRDPDRDLHTERRMKSGPALTCRDERRRYKVRAAKAWNGLDYLEVGDDQRELTVFFLDKAPESLENLRQENISIRPCGPGGREVQVVGWHICRLEDDERDDCLHITVDRPGGFSSYELCLVEVDEHGRPTGKPLAGLDPRYACLEFRFKVGCPSDLDCKAERSCPPEPRVEPEINYLAKDYAGFRQLILDRLALTLPEWKERHVPDLGIALVEVLAYVGDHLSYYQDAVATEAYLDTARRRISVRRHARLVDYPMHEGC